jgi:hypothetical protein
LFQRGSLRLKVKVEALKAASGRPVDIAFDGTKHAKNAKKAFVFL